MWYLHHIQIIDPRIQPDLIEHHQRPFLPRLLIQQMHGGADVAHPDDVRAPRDGGADNSWVVRVGHEGDDKVMYGGVGEEGGA